MGGSFWLFEYHFACRLTFQPPSTVLLCKSAQRRSFTLAERVLIGDGQKSVCDKQRDTSRRNTRANATLNPYLFLEQKTKGKPKTEGIGAQWPARTRRIALTVTRMGRDGKVRGSSLARGARLLANLITVPGLAHGFGGSVSLAGPGAAAGTREK